MPDLETAAGLLRYLAMHNEHGVWFLRANFDRCVPVPRWLWGHLNRVVGPNPIPKPLKLVTGEEDTE